jgi:hypothetical protein
LPKRRSASALARSALMPSDTSSSVRSATVQLQLLGDVGRSGGASRREAEKGGADRESASMPRPAPPP